jgi:signal transduction histidine kinase
MSLWQRHLSRTAAAVILTGLAVAVPAVAWYVAGSRAAVREAADIERSARDAARNEALRLAERLAGRLEAIRYAESRRPIYHYEHAYHDPTSTCECAALTPSPLAHGPNDPLIRAHFQIDAAGRLSVPTLPQPEALGSTPIPGADRAWAAEQVGIASTLTAETAVLAGALGTSGDEGATADPGEFEWRTVPLAGEPQLIAVRRVTGGRGTGASAGVIQGLVISVSAVRDLLRGSALEARFLAGEPPAAEADLAVIVPIECVTWRVTVDAERDLAAARARAHRARASFRRSFLFGSGTALVAGLFVIGLVWQTERLARQRSRFAAAAAHELRTPLAGLRLQAEMLAEGLGDPSRARAYARSLVLETERLGRVVSNVLDYARLERAALVVHPAPGDLATAVREYHARLLPALEEAGARVELRIEDGVPPVNFDRDALFHILQNLLDNAEKYTRAAADRTIEVRLAAAGPQAVALTVADHGAGVPAALRSRIFRPFQGALDPTSPAGLGLGLALVASLVAAHGGRVDLADTPGGGASFTVTLPARGAIG